MSAANWSIWGGAGGLNIFFGGRNVHQVWEAAGPIKGCWRRIPEKCWEGLPGTVPGKRGVPGRSAGSSAVACATKECGTAPGTRPGTPLFPGTVPGSPPSTFQEFLSSTPLCMGPAASQTK